MFVGLHQPLSKIGGFRILPGKIGDHVLFQLHKVECPTISSRNIAENLNCSQFFLDDFLQRVVFPMNVLDKIVRFGQKCVSQVRLISLDKP